MVVSKELVIERLQSNQSLTLAKLGRDLGLTRERIRQIADGIPGASRHKSERYCSCCLRVKSFSGGIAYRKGFCLDCWPVEKMRRAKERWQVSHIRFICEVCGEGFYRARSTVEYLERTKRHRIRWCSGKCQARVVFRERWLRGKNDKPLTNGRGQSDSEGMVKKYQIINGGRRIDSERTEPSFNDKGD